MSIIKCFKRNPCEECDYYCATNNTCRSKKNATSNPYVSKFDRMFCKPYKADKKYLNKLILGEEKMTDEEIKELYDKINGEKADESNEKSKNDMWLPLLLSLLVFSSSGQTPNTALEKEVAYLHGKVDAIEKIVAEKK